jgi:hypothetical protein
MKTGIHSQNNAVWFIIAGIGLFLLAIIMGGCAVPHVEGVNSPLPLTASSVDKASAHVSSADSLVTQAKPSSDKTGKALLDAAKGEHAKAQSDLAEAKATLAKAEAERAALVREAEKAEAAELKLEKSWGHRLQVWVTALFWSLVVLASLHFIAIVASLFLPPPYNFVASFVGKLCNPVAWVQGLVDHIHLKKCAGENANLANDLRLALPPNSAV